MIRKATVRELDTSTKKALKLLWDEYIHVMSYIKFLGDHPKLSYSGAPSMAGTPKDPWHIISEFRAIIARSDKALKQVEKDIGKIDEEMDWRNHDVKFGDMKLKRHGLKEHKLRGMIEQRRRVLLKLANQVISDFKHIKKDTDILKLTANDVEKLRAHYVYDVAKTKKDEESLMKWALNTEKMLKTFLAEYEDDFGAIIAA
ncbi:MAG: hypothetical protein ABIJ08_04910 [Nanoarchaeota archaeon]